MTFKVIVDNGKPCEYFFNDEGEVKTFLRSSQLLYMSLDVAYFDVIILDSLNNDVSDYFFNLRGKNES